MHNLESREHTITKCCEATISNSKIAENSILNSTIEELIIFIHLLGGNPDEWYVSNVNKPGKATLSKKMHKINNLDKCSFQGTQNQQIAKDVVSVFLKAGYQGKITDDFEANWVFAYRLDLEESFEL